MAPQNTLIDTTDSKKIIENINTVFTQNTLSVVDKLQFYDIIDLNFYIAERMRDRPSSYPKELSKKEKVLCKMQMIDRMVVWLVANNPEGELFLTFIKRYIKSLIKDIYAFDTTSKDGRYVKWPGIPADSANVLNTLYLHLNALYQKNQK